MAHFDTTLSGDADAFVAHLDRVIPGSSITANLESSSDQRIGEARMIVRVYERYSMMGGNRVSLAVSVLAVDGQLAVSATSAGGSQAAFFKVNTFGESSFLQKAQSAIATFA